MFRMSRLIYLMLIIPLLLIAACTGSEEDPEPSPEPETLEGIQVGSIAPAFTLENATGGDISLADFEGKPALLYFHMAVG